MKLLMHICCANCSLYPVKTLSEKGVSVTGLWFNPNIHPHAEYALRLNAVTQLQKAWGLSIEYIDYYGIKEFIQRTGNGGENRCNVCYEMRLDKTAQKAREIGADGFTTSLLISPNQKFDVIINIGREMERRHSVQFYFEDFRPGWKQGIELSKKLGLYRQKYCGCIYSEMEKHLERVKREEVR